MSFNNYHDLWKSYEKRAENGRYEDMSKILDTIREKAIIEGNDEQLLKTLFTNYSARFNVEEDPEITQISNTQEIIPLLKSVVSRQIAYSYLAELYETYLRNNQYRLRSLTNIEGTRPEKVSDWSITQLLNEIQANYDKSISIESKEVSINSYDAIIKDLDANGANLRSTIYDILAYRAINFYKTPQSYVIEPMYTFQLDKEEIFAKSSVFRHFEFDKEKEAKSSKLSTIKLFQDLEETHKNHQEVLLDIQLNRLLYAFQYSNLDDKHELYTRSLELLLKDNVHLENSIHVLKTLAQFYINQANRHTPPVANPYYRKAMDLLVAYRKNYNSAKAKQTIDYFEKLIEFPSLQFTTEQVFTINENFPISIKFRNLISASYSIYKLSPEDLKNYYLKSTISDYTTKKRQIRNVELSFPNTNDYAMHTYEIVVDGLSYGSYIIEFEAIHGIKSQQLIHISNIASCVINNESLQIVNRADGSIVPAKINFYKYQWNARSREMVFVNAIQTNSKGMVDIPSPENNRNDNYSYEIITDQDYLFLNQTVNNYRYSPSNDPYQIVAFTDRSIYRPGQTIYFKALLMEQLLGEDPKMKTNEEIEIELKDVNYQSVQKLVLKTNEYGSVHGSIDIPSDLLNGQFQLEIRYANTSNTFYQAIRVEEYKRPSFEVLTNDITESYALDEKVSLEGSVKNYAGFGLDNATVKYIIKRSQPYRYYYRIYNPLPDKVIAVGEVKTDEKGNFTIEFVAEAPKDKTQQENPLYNYSVQIDVTDKGGETRSITTNVLAGAYSYEIYVDPDLVITKPKQDSLALRFTNLNGENAKGKISYSIDKLNVPKKNFKQKRWTTPEYHQLDKDEYYNKTIDYPFREENLRENWSVNSRIDQQSIQIDGLKSLKIGELDGGVYRLTFSHPEAKEVTSYLEVIENKKWTSNPCIHLNYPKEGISAKSQVAIDVYSSVPELHLIQQISRTKRKTENNRYVIDGKSTIIQNVEETDKGGIGMLFSYFYRNRYYQEYVNIDVPWTEQNLKLTWETFRDNVIPGSKEKWKLKILDTKNNPVNVDILSSMYDASLDAFVSHQWKGLNFYTLNKYLSVNPHGFRNVNGYTTNTYFDGRLPDLNLRYPQLDTRLNQILDAVMVGAAPRQFKFRSKKEARMMEESVEMEASNASFDQAIGDVDEYKDVDDNKKEFDETEANNPPGLRTNLNETVFFLPELRTNAEGETYIEFTMNEALTRWKIQTFAQTVDAKYAIDSREITTSKDVMIFPKGPRFFREGDNVFLSSVVQNMATKDLMVDVTIRLFNGLTGAEITSKLIESNVKKLSVKKGLSESIDFNFKVPKNISSIRYQLLAEANGHRDGEENVAVVVTNKKLVVESKVIQVGANGKESLEVDALSKREKSSTLEPKLLQLSITSNPSWLAVQSLPYLMEYQYNCSEQIFSRYFANKLGSYIIQQNPGIEEVYATWREKDQLISALRKNEELKSNILQQTPWVMDAMSEDEQMQRLAFLFDLSKITKETKSDLNELIERQNGGLPWFPGGRPNRYITQYILIGLGQLNKMGISHGENQAYNQFITKALRFIEDEVIEDEKRWKSKKTISPLQIQFLYLLSFYPNHQLKSKTNSIVRRYEGILEETWLSHSLLSQSQAAFYFNRIGKVEMGNKIMESLYQRSIYKENLGRYYKETNGYQWFNSNIETQSIIINLFQEFRQDNKFIDELKVWLLSNKQTNRWKSTKATTQAVYAVVSNGTNWLSNDALVEVSHNGKKLTPKDDTWMKATGQYDIKFKNEEISRDYSNFEITNPNPHTAWASVSFQFIEEYDKIDAYNETPLKLERRLYRKVSDATGDKLIEIKSGDEMKVGDKLVVRLFLEVDRPMEFIHVKDVRASSTEPIDFLSSYKYKSGLYYYQETKDTETNFFIDYLPRGQYQLEYEQSVSMMGEYSAGLATVESMYAPEFGAHAEGRRIKIRK